MNDHKYRPTPLIEIQSVTTGILEGFDEIGRTIKNECRNLRYVAIETYPGTDKKPLIAGLRHIFDEVVDTDEVMFSNEQLNEILFDDLTDDRVFGRLTHKKIEHITDSLKFSQLVEKLSMMKGKILLIGFGSSRLIDKACVIFTSVTRWEIQMRFRNKTMDNYNAAISVRIRYACLSADTSLTGVLRIIIKIPYGITWIMSWIPMLLINRNVGERQFYEGVKRSCQ
jgi:hypothetical protein